MMRKKKVSRPQAKQFGCRQYAASYQSVAPLVAQILLDGLSQLEDRKLNQFGNNTDTIESKS